MSETQDSSSELKFEKLTPEHYIILSELRETQLINIILDLVGEEKKNLDTLLEDVAAPIVRKVKKAMKDQYATMEEITSVEDDVDSMNPEQKLLDVKINTVMFDHALELNSYEDLVRIASATPLRVSFEEREFLRLVESILDVSDYVDRVDTHHKIPDNRRVNHRIKSICSILDGLSVAYQYDIGQKLMSEHDYHEYAEFFQIIFEIVRRYKIANPEKMRNVYVKLMYFLIDLKVHAADFCFDCIIPIKTVHSLLSSKQNGLALLKDPLIRLATTEIMPEGKTRRQVQWEIEQKERAVKTLAQRYATKHSKTLLSRITNSWFSKYADNNPTPNSSLSPDPAHEGAPAEGITSAEIELCLHSLGDRNTFLRFNCEPCSKMINYLQQYFDPDNHEPEFSLTIVAGQNDSRLTHSHRRQYFYVLQSLTLWKEVLHEMLGLWSLAEVDILNPSNPYVLKDSGQGLQRVQNAPLIYRSMTRILKRVQAKVGSWYGSSEIHLGDHNVPNALLFIDKYLQVPRILSPIILCLEKIPELAKSSTAMQQYLTEMYQSEESLIKTILVDFFRHAFDGSGADNFYDAGSCVDGRLTSAWNWCSKIELKPYFPVFLLTGFVCFDGRF